MERRIYIFIAVVALLLSSCSSKGVRMPSHRKRAHCDCPTFTMNEVTAVEVMTTTLPYGTD